MKKLRACSARWIAIYPDPILRAYCDVQIVTWVMFPKFPVLSPPSAIEEEAEEDAITPDVRVAA